MAVNVKNLDTCQGSQDLRPPPAIGPRGITARERAQKISESAVDGGRYVQLPGVTRHRAVPPVHFGGFTTAQRDLQRRHLAASTTRHEPSQRACQPGGGDAPCYGQQYWEGVAGQWDWAHAQVRDHG